MTETFDFQARPKSKVVGLEHVLIVLATVFMILGLLVSSHEVQAVLFLIGAGLSLWGVLGILFCQNDTQATLVIKISSKLIEVRDEDEQVRATWRQVSQIKLLSDVGKHQLLIYLWGERGAISFDLLDDLSPRDRIRLERVTRALCREHSVRFSTQE